MGTAMDIIPSGCPSPIYVSSSPALALAQQLTISYSRCTPATHRDLQIKVQN